MTSKNTICRWFNGDAAETARFYAETFPDSSLTPPVLTQAIADPDPGVARRAFEAMMTMKKIDIAAIEAARCG